MCIFSIFNIICDTGLLIERLAYSVSLYWLSTVQLFTLLPLFHIQILSFCVVIKEKLYVIGVLDYK